MPIVFKFVARIHAAESLRECLKLFPFWGAVGAFGRINNEFLVSIEQILAVQILYKSGNIASVNPCGNVHLEHDNNLWHIRWTALDTLGLGNGPYKSGAKEVWQWHESGATNGAGRRS